MNLSATGRIVLDQHFSDTAAAFNVPAGNPAAGQNYAATPSVAQVMYDKIVEHGDDFLRSINMYPVSDMKGERIGMDLTGRIGSRTDVSGDAERVPKNVANTAAKLYELFATEFDVALKYSKIDLWSKFPDFRKRYMNLVRQAIADDMLQTGWTGTSVAATTDLVANPLLEDLNKGWLQIIREFNAGSQYLLGAAGSVTLGSADFKNLDVLAHAAKEMLPVYHRNRKDLVLCVGSDVLSSQEETYLDANGDTPTEKALLTGRITKAYASLPTVSPAFFPQSSLLITPLKNLSIYYQDSSVRRLQKDKPEKNEVQDFNSVNLGYVVEEEETTAFIENITFA